ncbi:MAG TPA: GAF domain-containing protein [Thermodesulfobacteriota bacterium]|nr:GAF domain-containing protein [Thermodesulfobacteriota bacterium]
MDHIELDRQISDALNLPKGSVLILTTNKHDNSLEFAYPDTLNGNLIPVNSRTIIGRAVITKQPYISNNVQEQRDFNFLCLFLKKNTDPAQNMIAYPVQKMITYPILFVDKVIAVLQILRRGYNPSETINFNKEDVEKIKSIIDDATSIRLVKSCSQAA